MGKLNPSVEEEQADIQVYSHITQRTMSKLALPFPIPTLLVVRPTSSWAMSALMSSGRKRRAKPTFHHSPELGQEELYPRIRFCQLSRSPQELGFGMSHFVYERWS